MCHRLLEDERTPERAKARGTLLSIAGTLSLLRAENEEARSYLRAAIELQEEIADDAGLARSLLWFGGIDLVEGRLLQAHELYTRSLALQRRHGDPSAIAFALTRIGIACELLSRREEAQAAYLESLELARGIGWTSGVAIASFGMGRLHLEHREIEDAKRWLEEALALYRCAEIPFGVANTVMQLGRLARAAKQLASARDRFKEAGELLRRLGDIRVYAGTLVELADAEAKLGNSAAGQRGLVESARLGLELGLPGVTATATWCLGWLDLEDGRHARAARRLACATALMERSGFSFEAYHVDPAQAQARLELALGAEECRRLWDSGREGSVEELLAEGTGLE
jgi:tetratricopeptide (TPR) repeat protein